MYKDICYTISYYYSTTILNKKSDKLFYTINLHDKNLRTLGENFSRTSVSNEEVTLRRAAR